MATRPPWLQIADKEIGISEISGPESNARINEYASTTTLKATSDEVAWCSSFINWCMMKAGQPYTKLANARSWLDWGRVLDAPIVGCVVIFSRGNDQFSGHVALCDHEDISNGIIRVIGGNQGNSVSVARMSVKSVLGYRWPTSYSLPGETVKLSVPVETTKGIEPGDTAIVAPPQVINQQTEKRSIPMAQNQLVIPLPSGKNWKTSIFGTITAIGFSLTQMEDPTYKLVGQIVTIVGGILTALFAKDGNVTGGSIQQ